MNLTGKTVLLELSGDAVSHFFGQESRGDAEEMVGPPWDVVGEVVGETPGLGLWFRVVGLALKGNRDVTLPLDLESVHLIRWVSVLNAEVLPEKPKNIEKMGFRPV